MDFWANIDDTTYMANATNNNSNTKAKTMTTAIDYSTPEMRAELMERVTDQMQDLICGLYDRWQDEKGHEDWSEYRSAIVSKIEAILPAGSNARMSRRGSFRITCAIPGFPYQPVISLTQTPRSPRNPMGKSMYGWSSR